MAEPNPKAGSPPVADYAKWLNEWHDLQVQVEECYQNQQALCDQIAPAMGLEIFETRTLTYLGIAYEVTGMDRFVEGEPTRTCTIKAKPIEEVH